MNSSKTVSLNLEDLVKQLREIKATHSSVGEDFDLELFTLGYLTALQALNNIDRLNENLDKMVTLRNLEKNEKINSKDKIDILGQITNLASNSQNLNNLSNFNILPEKLIKISQDFNKEQTGQPSSISVSTSSKRSKSNEGKQTASLERSGRTADNMQQNSCVLCGHRIRGPNSARLQGCGHFLHDNCLRAYLHNEIEEESYPICCPINHCGKEIEPAVVQNKVDNAHAKIFWKYAFVRNLNKPDVGYSWCPTLGCKYFYIAQKPLLMMFRCPLCQKHNCLNCRAEYHRGQTCDIYQKTHNINMPNLEKDVVRFKQCPECMKWVESNGGDTLSCSCGKVFCVNCGNNSKDCVCEVKKNAQGLNMPSGSNDYTDLYKMIMKDQEAEIIKMKENW